MFMNTYILLGTSLMCSCIRVGRGQFPPQNQLPPPTMPNPPFPGNQPPMPEPPFQNNNNMGMNNLDNNFNNFNNNNNLDINNMNNMNNNVNNNGMNNNNVPPNNFNHDFNNNINNNFNNNNNNIPGNNFDNMSPNNNNNNKNNFNNNNNNNNNFNNNIQNNNNNNANVKTKPNGRRVVAYYQNYKNVPISSIDGDKITHLIYTFLKFNSQTLDVEDGDTFLDRQKVFDEKQAASCKSCKGNYYEMFKFRQKYPHVRIMLSIGGWVNSALMSKALLTPESRKKVVVQTTNIMRQFNFDGIDIDWEFPIVGGIEGGTKNENDGVNLIDTLRLFREQWQQYNNENRHYELTVAMPAIQQSYLTGDNAMKFSSYVDFIMLMSYEFQYPSQRTRHHANIFNSANSTPDEMRFTVENSVKSYLGTFPNDQIVLGIPCYGRGFDQTEAGSNHGFQMPYKSLLTEPISYQNLTTFLREGKYKEYYDETAEGAWAYSEQTRIFYSFENGRSALAKAKYAVKNNIGGVMLWDVTTDLPSGDKNSILYNLNQGLDKVDKTKVNRGNDCAAKDLQIPCDSRSTTPSATSSLSFPLDIFLLTFINGILFVNL